MPTLPEPPFIASRNSKFQFSTAAVEAAIVYTIWVSPMTSPITTLIMNGRLVDRNNNTE